MRFCRFCAIARGEIPAELVYEDAEILAFKDRFPRAAIHRLVIPRQHADSLNDAIDLSPDLLGRLLQVAAHVAADAGISESGYRVVTNCGADAQQSVHHLHLHVLGGGPLGVD